MDSFGTIIPLPGSTTFQTFITRIEEKYLKSDFENADFDDEKIQIKAINRIYKAISEERERKALESYKDYREKCLEPYAYTLNAKSGGAELPVEELDASEKQAIMRLYDREVTLKQRKRMYDLGIIRFTD